MNEIKIGMVDQDEVFTKGGLLRAINIFLKANYPEEYFSKFYMQKAVPEKRRDEFFYEYLPTCDLYENCIIIPNSIETIMELEESGKYKMHIATDWRFPEIDRACGWNLINKHDFLMKVVPLDSGRFAFVGDKSIIAAHVRIDDKLSNLTDTVFPAERMFLFPAYHNVDLTNEYLNAIGVEKPKDWLEIKRKLLP